jgi:hypothetical protein
MQSLILIGGLLSVLAAACGGDRQIVLELTGAVPGAERVEVLLLDPLVMAKRQVNNASEPNTLDRLETVFYMAERSRTTFELLGAATDGFQFEVQGGGGAYVPLVAARAGDKLLAMGIYDPAGIFAAELGREHAPAAVTSVGDVTIYPIELEPVDRSFAVAASAPQQVLPREVMTVPCGAGGEVSGLVWRRADQHQLRVVLAIPSRPPPGAPGEAGKDLLDPPDLDCDQHSPGPAGVLRISVGDERDCDDTASAVAAGVRESCSTFDEDCNPLTTLSPKTCADACASSVCFCDDAISPDREVCAALLGTCKLPSSSSGGSGLLPCASAGFVLLPPCQGGCEVLLESVPEGLEVAISDEMTDSGQGPGRWVPISDGKAWLSVKGSGPLPNSGQTLAVRFKTGAGTSPPFALALEPSASECTDPRLLTCTTL